MEWKPGEFSITPPNPDMSAFGRMTDRARRVVTLSLREALQLGHNYVGTEHLLLGLIREGEKDGGGVAAKVLAELGLELPKVRQAVIGALTQSRAKTARIDALAADISRLQSELDELRKGTA